MGLTNSESYTAPRESSDLPGMWIRPRLREQFGRLPIREVAVDCYLSSSHDDPEFFSWNGPSLLSPLTRSKDIFSYASAMIATQINWLEIHFSVILKYTGESVAVLPFFLPRVEVPLGSLRQCREQILEAMHQYTRSIRGADFRFEVFIWPSDGRETDSMGGCGLPSMTLADPGSALDPDHFVNNISCSF
jgi:hypothetical protein